MIYNVGLSGNFFKVVEIEADSEKEAIKKADEMFDVGEIYFESEDFDGEVEYNIFDD